ncbi:MAG: N-glycosylase/DNA lyase [Candidatus Bathyarchaeia archaeon]|nr:N-glycosylase/DNA lyase [Candidatus Bathyarchaeota archaeon]
MCRESCGLNSLASIIGILKNSYVKDLVAARVEEFKRNRSKPITEIFKELCFCILTANFNAEKAIRMQAEIDDGFLSLPEDELAKSLRALGHRYPDSRAKYIVEARRLIPEIERILNSPIDEKALRDWFAKNVKGLGYKESSHFLRNIGFMNLAIIDFHITNLLSRYGLMEKPKTMTKRRYIEAEKILIKLSKITGLSLGELDLYLWFIETGKILK